MQLYECDVYNVQGQECNRHPDIDFSQIAKNHNLAQSYQVEDQISVPALAIDPDRFWTGKDTSGYDDTYSKETRAD